MHRHSLQEKQSVAPATTTTHAQANSTAQQNNINMLEYSNFLLMKKTTLMAIC
jgi:hypothetical protein